MLWPPAEENTKFQLPPRCKLIEIDHGKRCFIGSGNDALKDRVILGTAEKSVLLM